MKRVCIYTVAVLGVMPSAALAYQPMADYWSSFTDGALGTAVSMASDMLPVLAALAGLALAERVVYFVLHSTRG